MNTNSGFLNFMLALDLTFKFDMLYFQVGRARSPTCTYDISTWNCYCILQQYEDIPSSL